jgi:hypothetical protein
VAGAAISFIASTLLSAGAVGYYCSTDFATDDKNKENSASRFDLNQPRKQTQ